MPVVVLCSAFIVVVLLGVVLIAHAATVRMLFSAQTVQANNTVNASVMADWDGDRASWQMSEANNVTVACRLYLSNDGYNWQYSADMGSARANASYTSFTPPAARYMRIECNASYWSGKNASLTGWMVTRD